MAENNERVRGDAKALLEPFVGTWTSRGWTIPQDGEPVVEVTGTDRYEWMPGGFFLLHHVDVMFGEFPMQVLEVIGYDPASAIYRTQYYDCVGNTGAFTARVDDGVWTLASETERARLTFGADGQTMTAHWENRRGTPDWVPWMDMEFTRAAESRA